MEISFSSKKEEEIAEEDKKIEFGKKFDPNLGMEKKTSRPVNEDEKDTEFDEVLEEEPVKENFFSKFLSKFQAGSNEDNNGVLEVNLVKEEIVKFFDWQKGLLVLFLFVFSSMAIVSFVYWGISWWGGKKQYAQNPAYIQLYYRINKEIKDLEEDVKEVMEFKQRLDMANFLLTRHIYWSNFFDFLENNTLSRVYFSTFSGDISGRYSLSATTNSFDAINAQTKRFLENPYVRAATVDSGSILADRGNTTVSFEISFMLNPEIFLKKK